MRTQSVLCVLICTYALFVDAHQFYQLNEETLQKLPRLPSSFSDEEWNSVQAAIQDAVNCQANNSYWDDSSEDFNEFGYPNCISRLSSYKIESGRINQDSCSRIPKIIHQQWKNDTIPDEWNDYVEGWKQMNPDWIFLLWSDADQLEWIETHYDWFLEIFRNFPFPVERADAFRYFLMWAYGGVYVDIDYECKRPLNDYISVIRKPVALVSPKDNGFSNSMLISVPQHELWGIAIEQIYENPSYVYGITKHEHVINTTGPKFLNRIIAATYYNDDICSLQKSLFHPCNFCMSDEQCDQSCEGCYASHHYAKTWNDWSSTAMNTARCNAPASFSDFVRIAIGSGVLFGIGYQVKKKMDSRKEVQMNLHDC